VVAENAAQLCDAPDALIYRVTDEGLRMFAKRGPMPAPTPLQPISRGLPVGRAVVDRQTVHVHDMAVAVETEFPEAPQRYTGTRTILATPLLREGVPIGAIVIRRTEVRPFSEKQIALLKTFADQAVIAIENVRLFKELQERNRDLTVALEQQTATSEILRVIASSPTDIQPVLDTVAENAARLCEADDALIRLLDGNVIRLVAHYGRIPPGGGADPIVSRGSVFGRAIIDRQAIHVHDLTAE